MCICDHSQQLQMESMQPYPILCCSKINKYNSDLLVAFESSLYAIIVIIGTSFSFIQPHKEGFIFNSIKLCHTLLAGDSGTVLSFREGRFGHNPQMDFIEVFSMLPGFPGHIFKNILHHKLPY